PLGKTAPDPRQVVQGLVDHFNGVLNRTVSKSRLSAVPDRRVSHPRFNILRYVSGSAEPLELNKSSMLLWAEQMIDVDGDRCRTVTYHYRLQLGEDPKSTLIRWEFLREKPKADYDYPLAHVHVEATLGDGRHGKDIHIPTRRVALELVLWHLISDWGIEPLNKKWREILNSSLRG